MTNDDFWIKKVKNITTTKQKTNNIKTLDGAGELWHRIMMRYF